MNLHDYATILRRQWKSALIVTLALLAASAALTLLITPRYTATTRMFFAVQGTQTASELAMGSTFAENQMKSYEEVATSPIVLDPVIKQLGLSTTSSRLAGAITATVPPDTVILEVSVSEPDPQQARLIADAVGAKLAEVAVTLSPARPDGTDAVRATILAPARVSAKPSSPNVRLNLAVGLAAGLLLGLGVAVLRNGLDTKIRSASDLATVTDSPLLATIVFDTSVPQHAAVVSDEPSSASSEAIRRLRTNLQFVGNGAGSKVVVVTSSVSGEGKTTTSLNLAVALADAGSKVVLVDADLRRPSIAEHTGLEGRVGLTTVLIGRAQLADVTQSWQSANLDILPAGDVPPNPSELLGSSAMVELIEELRQCYDIVLLDSPPLLPVTDAAILGGIAGGAVVVVGADRIHRPQLAEALATLGSANATVFGLVLNKVERREHHGYGYGYGYGRYTSHKAAETLPVAASSATATAAAVTPRHAVTAPSAAGAPEPGPAAPAAAGDPGATTRHDQLSGPSRR